MISETNLGVSSTLLLRVCALLLTGCSFGMPDGAGADEAVDAKPPLNPVVDKREGEDWPQFLGPAGTSVSTETQILTKWPKAGPAVLWKAEVGTGYSAPSVMGNRLVLHHRVDDDEIIECFEAGSGRKLWAVKYATSYEDPYDYNNGPRTTPLLTKTRCYTCGAGGMLTCSDLATGKKIWQRELKQDFNLPEWFFGVGSTPILVDDRLIMQVGGQPESGLVAFQAETGAVLWESIGKKTWDGALTNYSDGDKYEWTGREQIASYSSPIAAEIHGKLHVLCLMRHGLVSVDPATGAEHFHYWFRVRVHESVNAARPVVVDDHILISAAYKLGSVYLKVAEDGKSVSEVWKDRKSLESHWTTPIVRDGYAYGFSGRHEYEGELRCIKLSDGSLQWSTTGYAGDLKDLPPLALNRRTGLVVDQRTSKTVVPPFFGRGSLLMVQDQFITLGEYGTLALVEVDPKEYREIGRAFYPEIHSPAWAAPVLSRGRLFLRCEDGLLCLDVARPNDQKPAEVPEPEQPDS